ncbi:PQQ-dependent sugar dehydrogenase [Mariniflexile soesokkakense]|uniref:PQQ-dependent sugar dehydrogenase n=1 Tax=Mariniflexile soesokkakense TaxID=1343160 RepID=A0ABV0ABJ4_9FLAO
MNISNKNNKILIAILGVLIFATLSFVSFLVGPGFTNPEPVGRFLNGNFPDYLPDNPYVEAFPNLRFDSPLTFTLVPNSNVIVIGQRNGIVYSFEDNNEVQIKNLVVDFSGEVGNSNDNGFLGLAIHPQFGQSGKNYFYVYYQTKDSNGGNSDGGGGFVCDNTQYVGSSMILKRFEVNPNTFKIVAGTELVMMKRRMFGFAHYGGSLNFGNDGYLYLTTGDQSSYSKPQNTWSNLDGGILRLDVNQDPSKSHVPIRKLPAGALYNDEFSGVGYWIPNDNPFLSPNGSRFEEYYTVGHRNPHRMTKDRLTGIFYIGEVGEFYHDEINVLEKGQNYGWPIFEGYRDSPGTNCTTMLDGMTQKGPLVAFPRAEANALIGGYIYRGSSMTNYYGKYICADFGGGSEIWAVDINTGDYELIASFTPTQIISFGEGNDGELYLLKLGDNVPLYKMVPSGQPESGFPQKLSETGAFKNLETLEPNEGVIPYELIESFWSDGAKKKRWMVIPNDGTHNTPAEKIKFSEDGDWEFPVGSVLIKHFELPIDELNPNITKRLETRFSVKTSPGSFYYLTYKWNDEQTDAVLLDSGIEETIEIKTQNGSTKNQTWTYPGTQDCITCHNPVIGGTIGPRTRYLNSEMTYPKTTLKANQLVTLSHLGILDEAIDDNKALQYQTHKALDDSNASLEERSRSYLDLNCAYCHRPGGTAERAKLDMRLFNSLDQTNLLYANPSSLLGIEGARVVAPGDKSKSVLFHRMNSVDPNIAMPTIAKNVIDKKAVDLIGLWIDQLEPTAYNNIALTATARTSYVSPWESLAAVNNDFTPASSNDKSNLAYGNWNNPNSIQWVEYNWPESHKITSTQIYWFDDNGGILIPTMAYIEYWDSNKWVKVGNVPLEKDSWNTLAISNIVTTKLRVSMLNSNESTGILEWRVIGAPLSALSVKSEKTLEIGIFPNPTNGLLNINLTNFLNREVKIFVYDSSGKVVINKTIPKNHGAIETFNLWYMAEGVYYVKFKSDSIQFSKKIIVKK